MIDEIVTYSAEFAVDMVSILDEGEMEEGQEMSETLLQRFFKTYKQVYPNRSSNKKNPEASKKKYEVKKDRFEVVDRKKPSDEIDREIFTNNNLIDDQLASNNWVVHGNLTASGRPLLAGDPHLGTSLPCVWTLQHLQYKENGKTKF